jgi:1-deoxy-D-xylulose-5-phosphate synthase
VALQKLPVVFALDRAGCVGSDGPTHHGVFDASYLRMIPGMVIMQAKDEDEFVDMLHTSFSYENGPVALRYPRGSAQGVPIKKEPALIPLGKAEPLRPGDDVSIWALGNMVPIALKAAHALAEHGWSAEVVNARFVKPLDRECLAASARRSRLLVTLEDNVLAGGFGSGVLEVLDGADIRTPVMRFGWPDQFVEQGTLAELMRRHGLDSASVLARVLSYLERTREQEPEGRHADADVGWRALA